MVSKRIIPAPSSIRRSKRLATKQAVSYEVEQEFQKEEVVKEEYEVDFEYNDDESNNTNGDDNGFDETKFDENDLDDDDHFPEEVVEEEENDLDDDGHFPEEEVEEEEIEATEQLGQDLSKIPPVLASMNLPATMYAPGTLWLDLLLEVCSARETTKEAIRQFSARKVILFLFLFLQHTPNIPCSIAEKTFPHSEVDVTAFINDTERETWHTHCPRMNGHWEDYCSELIEILGNDIDITTLTKPSGPLGAVLHMQWNYPTWSTRKTNIKFGHVMVHFIYIRLPFIEILI